MKADYHVHTNYSDDSTELMEDVVKHAIKLKFNEIAFTEHVDYGVKTDLNCNYEEYFKELFKLKEIYKNEITIKAGMEFGMQVHTIDKYEEDFNKWPFDFILLSNHQVDDKELWLYDYQKGKTQDEYQLGYYNEILNVIKKYKNYSVLAHLDAIKRYDENEPYSDSKILPIVKEILTQVIKDGKGIEINTSSFKYNLPDLTPSKEILKLYKDLGGEIITIGSDAHKKEHLGDHFDEVKMILKDEIGFSKFCTFDKMKPIFWDL